MCFSRNASEAQTAAHGLSAFSGPRERIARPASHGPIARLSKYGVAISASSRLNDSVHRWTCRLGNWSPCALKLEPYRANETGNISDQPWLPLSSSHRLEEAVG